MVKWCIKIYNIPLRRGLVWKLNMMCYMKNCLMIILTSVYLLNYLSISNKIYSFYLSSLSIINSLFFSINFISLLKFSSDKSSFSKKSFSFNASFNLSLILFVTIQSHAKLLSVNAYIQTEKQFYMAKWLHE